MFTGIVQCMADVVEVGPGRLVLDDPGYWHSDPWQIGESIAVDGCCLTLARFDGALAFDLSPETWERTVLSNLKVSSRVNLERALKVGDRFGGHIVQGHVDGRGTFLSRTGTEEFQTLRFSVPEPRYVVDKGSIGINGVSLTVVQPDGNEFDIAAIPHTLANTSLGTLAPGEPVNIEYDVVARYIERLLSLR